MHTFLKNFTKDPTLQLTNRANIPVGIRRPLNVEWTSIWCPSVHQKYGTSSGRPNSVHYRRPVDTPIGRPTDVHLRPIQRRHVCKFISMTISSLIYFEVLSPKIFKYFSLSLKMRLLKRYQRMPEEKGKRTNQIFDSVLIWTNQFPVSFTVSFWEDARAEDVLYRYGFTDADWR